MTNVHLKKKLTLWIFHHKRNDNKLDNKNSNKITPANQYLIMDRYRRAIVFYLLRVHVEIEKLMIKHYKYKKLYMLSGSRFSKHKDIYFEIYLTIKFSFFNIV